MNTESTARRAIVAAHRNTEAASMYENVDFVTLEMCERMYNCDRLDGLYRR